MYGVCVSRLFENSLFVVSSYARQDMDGMMSDNDLSASTLSNVGKGQGAILGKVWNGKGKCIHLPLKDKAEENDEEGQMEDAMNKSWKMLDLLMSTAASFEEAMTLVTKSQCWSKAAKMDAEALLEALKHEMGHLRKLLLDKNIDSQTIKDKVIEAGVKVIECIANIKEFKQTKLESNSVGTASSSE